MTESFAQGYALIIGIGADLPNTVDDARGLANILKDSDRCAYPPDQVHLLTGEQATAARLRTALETLAASTNSESTVLVYFSGHGYRATASIGEAYYLLPYGYDVQRLSKTAISGREFTDRLRAIPAQKLLVLLDCCHAGGVGDAKAPGLELAKAPLPPEATALLAEGSGRVLVASSQEDELSFAGKPYSAFTLALIEALAGIGVAKKDGYVRVADVALHAREVVPGRTNQRQHPILHFEHADNFVLAYYAGGDTQPKSLPFDVEPEIEPEPGAWAIFGQRGQTVHGTQINIANVGRMEVLSVPSDVAPTSLQHHSTETQKRRIDATFPANVKLHQTAKLFVEARLPTSPKRDDQSTQDSDILVPFKSDPITHKLQPLNLEALVTAPGFEIHGEAAKTITVMPDGDSMPREYLLTARHPGRTQVQVEVIHDTNILGQLTLNTNILTESESIGRPRIFFEMAVASLNIFLMIGITSDLSGQIVHGPQTTITGDVHGPVLSGQFGGPVVVGGGEAVDLRGSQGAIYKPSGPVEQQFGSRTTIMGDGNVIGGGSHATVIKQQTTGVTVDAFLRLLTELRQALPTAGLDPDIAQAVESDLQVAESQARKAEPNAALILLKLKSVAELLATADGVCGIVERVRPLAQQAVEWAGKLFR